MKSVTTITVMEEMKVKFQTLWIFVMFNYLYADVLGLHDSSVLKEIITGQVDSLQVDQGFLLGAAILMETAIAMVLLSRILKYQTNRRANMIAGAIHTAAVSLSMFVGTPAPYYIFFGTIEIACTAFIVWYAWRWVDPERTSGLA
jgi:MFS family permease